MSTAHLRKLRAFYTFFALYWLLSTILPYPAFAKTNFSAGVPASDVAKPAVIQVRSGATATFRFSDKSWPVAIGGTASGLIVSPDGDIVTSSRIVQMMTKTPNAIREELAEQFFRDVQKEVGHRLSESERAYIAEQTTMIEEVKSYQKVILSGGDSFDFKVNWTGNPPSEALLPRDPSSNRQLINGTIPPTTEDPNQIKATEKQNTAPLIKDTTAGKPGTTSTETPADQAKDSTTTGTTVPATPAAPVAGSSDASGGSDASGSSGTPGSTGIKPVPPAVDRKEPTPPKRELLAPVTPNRGATSARTTVKDDALFDPLQELAVIKINAKNLPSLELGKMPSGETEVTILGFPGSSEATTLFAPPGSEEVSAVSGMVQPARYGKSTDKSPLFDIEAAIAPAATGGPVITSDGNLIGIAGRVPKGPSLYPLIGATTINQALRLAAVSAETSETTGLYGEALAMYRDGYVSKTIQLVRQILALDPHNGSAKQLLEEAQQRKENGDDRIYWSDLIKVIAAVTVVLIVAALTLWLLMKRYKLTWKDIMQMLLPKRKRKAVPNVTATAAVETATTAAPADNVVTRQPAATINPAVSPQLIIRFKSGPLKGRRYAIPADGLYIGRDPVQCQIIINDPTISKCHAFLAVHPYDPQTLVITDKGSTNGTYVQTPKTAPITGPQALAVNQTVFLGQQIAFVVQQLTPSPK
ncbi:trypsin-like peptidase domain-containing protein [Heliophilum fasciatum]|uniref:trypsin-like peptidase domain-containing protein n=1 Tax=Heliophilum fasciatum TaxID=35700 RepID=UPI001404D438|nr:trypsin-like peptidase domain-containing protein [Heliophilum fasciatum]MCW2277341.1 S1-C subfamily serine protease [Heliophilum fasciatum]